MEQNKLHCVGDACTVLVSVVADSLYQTEMAYNFAGQTSATTVAR